MATEARTLVKSENVVRSIPRHLRPLSPAVSLARYILLGVREVANSLSESFARYCCAMYMDGDVCLPWHMHNSRDLDEMMRLQQMSERTLERLD